MSTEINFIIIDMWFFPTMMISMNVENSKRGDFQEGVCYSLNGVGELGKK